MQVALLTDSYGNPTLNISLKTNDGNGIEPIDILQRLFSCKNGCNLLNVSLPEQGSEFDISPNPTKHYVVVKDNLRRSIKNYLLLYNLFEIKSQRYEMVGQSQEINLEGICPGFTSINFPQTILYLNKVK